MDNNPIYNNDMRSASGGENTNYNTGYGYQYSNQYNHQYNRQYNTQGYYNYGGNYYGQGYYNGGYYNQGYYGQGYNAQPYYGYNYYQNLYNMFGGHNPIVEKEFSELSKRGIVTGGLMLGIFFMQIVVSTVISLLPVAEIYRKDTTFSMGVGVILQAFYMLLPALLIYVLSKSEDREKMNVFNKPKSGKLYLLGVVAGFAACLLGNTASSVFSAVLSGFGVTFFSGSEGMSVPTDFISILLFVINTAVMPALFEEFAFRGVIMQPLRKYGDWFAILASAFCFAVVHANMIQIPFAFVAGLSLGYFCIKTNSIWTSITIHFLNNFLSVCFSVYFEKNPDSMGLPYYIIVSTCIFLGVFAFILFKKSGAVKLKKDATAMNKKQILKRAAFGASPTIVIAVFFAAFTSINLMQITAFIGVIAVAAGLIAVGVVFINWVRRINTEKCVNPKKRYTASLILTVISCCFLAIAVFAALGQGVQ